MPLLLPDAFICPVRDPAAIAAALGRLVSDAGLRESMGRASRERAREFSVERMVDRTVELYEEIVGRKSAGMSAGTARKSACAT